MTPDDRRYMGTRIVLAAIVIVAALIILWATGVDARPDW
jgi:hypothetical protein